MSKEADETSTSGASGTADVMPTHTPGPWEALIDKDCIYIDAVPSLPEKQRSTIQVAQLQARSPQVMEKEAEANAHLIAAAPEMLDGLRQIDEYLTRDENDGVSNFIGTRSELHQHVRHLIDLATGQNGE